MKEIKISIIIPMYNAAVSIERCLKSVLGQTYSNLEIILVNDGSTDNSLEIANKFASQDTRLLIMDIKNQGVSNARNIGVEKCTGEYVIFVDSDDYIELDMIATLVEYIEKYRVDVIVYDPIFESINGEYIKIVTKNIVPDVYLDKKRIEEKVLPWIYGNTKEQKEALIRAKSKQKDLYADCYNAPWEAAYKKECIQEIQFNTNLNIYEDLLFNVEVFSKCQSMVYCEKAMYHYISNMSGSLATKYHENYVEMKKLLFAKMLENVDNNQLPERLKKDLQYRIVEDLMSILINESKGESKNSVSKVKEYIEVPYIKKAIYGKKSEKKSMRLLIFLLKRNWVAMVLYIVQMRIKMEKGRKC